MSKGPKIIIRLLIGFGAIAVVLVVALLLVAISIDPNQYKQQIATVAEQATGYTIDIGGEIKLDLFPVISLDVARISIDSPAPFEEELVFIQRASAQLKLWPLLQRRLEIGKITLSEPQVSLLVASDGRNNWEGESSADSAAPEDASFDLMSILPGLSLVGISVTGAGVVWRDERTQEHVQVDQLNLEVGAIAPGNPTAVRLHGSMLDHSRGFSVSMDLAGSIMIDPSLERINMENLDARGSFQRGDDPAVDARLVASAVFDLAQDRLLLEQAGVDLGEAHIDMDGSIAGLLSSRRTMDLKVNSNTFNLRDLTRILQVELPQTRSRQAFQQFSASGDLAAVLDGEQVVATIRQLAMTLDDSRLQVQGEVAWAPMLQMKLAADVDSIDVAKYLPPPDEVEASAMPLELPIDDLHTEVASHGGRIDVSRLVAMVFGGKVDGNASIQAGREGGATRWSAQGRADGVDLARVITAFAPEDTWAVRGTGGLSWQLRASGDDAQALTKSLDGQVELSIVEGGLKEPKLAANLERAIAFLEKRPRKNSGDEVVLDRINASFDLKQGVAKNDDLQIDMPFLRAQGAGDIDLVSARVDYRIQTGLCSATCKSGRAQPNLPLAIRISGPFDDIDYSLDLGVVRKAAKELIEEGVQRVLGENTEELLQDKDRVVDTVKDRIKEGIGSIFGGKKLPF